MDGMHWSNLGRRAATGLAACLIAAPLLFAVAARAEDTPEAIALNLAMLLRASRKVISDNQAKINDASIGDKGLSADAVMATAKENFKAATKTDLDSIDPNSKLGKLIQVEIKAIRDAMDENQERLNQKDVGFKGFLPAVFARLVWQKFKEGAGEQALLKLTAPKEIVRNRANRPDDWESNVFDTKFKGSTASATAQPVSETVDYKGKPAYRLMLAEYYNEGCLSCHGDPKGEKDITGGIKEGLKLGDLGGAISVVVYK